MDIRWQQRFENYKKALSQLNNAIDLMSIRELSHLEKQGVLQAFKYELIIDGDIWMDMIRSRNLTSHTYDESTVDDIIKLIRHKYLSAFLDLQEKFTGIKEVK